MRNDFVKKNFYPLIKLAIPLVMTGVLQNLIFFFETLFIARLGQETLAAGALVSWLFGTLVVILFGTLGSINVLIAHKQGANDQESIALIMRDGLLLAVLLAIPIFLLFWNMAPIFLVLGQQPAIVVLARTYLHALAWGILPSCIMIAFLELIMGLGHARTIMVFTVIQVLLNILFSFVLIFGKWSFPAFGIAGAGWGMTVSNWLSVMILVFYVLTNHKYQHYFKGIFNRSKPSFLWELLRVGAPMGAMYCVEITFFFALTLVMGAISIQLLAATQVTLQYDGICMSAIFSIAQAITVRMSHLLGANELQAAKQAGITGVLLAGIAMVVVALFYWFCPWLLIAVDFNIHDVRNVALIRDIEIFLAISAIFQIFEAMRIALFGVLRAFKDTRFTLFTSIVCFWCIALPLGYFLAHRCRLGGAGLWWGLVVSSVFSVLLLCWRFRFRCHLAAK